MKQGVALLCLLLGHPIAAQQTLQGDGAQDLRIAGMAGFGGACIRGERAPVQVEIENKGGADREIVLVLTWASIGLKQREVVSLESLADRRGPLHKISFTLPARSKKIVSSTLVAPEGDNFSVWAFVLGASGKSVAGAEIGARLYGRPTKLVAIVGSDRPEGLDLPRIETAWIRPAHLPEDRAGYAGLEALLWLDGRVSDIRAPAQLDALRAWISSGGHLIVARSNLVGIEKTPVAELLPVALQAGREVEQIAALASIPGKPPAPEGKAALAGARLLRGRALLSQDSVPVVADALLDGGRVTFVAFDPSRAPIAGWNGARTFWAWLLPGAKPDPPGPPEEFPAPRLLGSAALARAAASFPDLGAPAITGLIVLIGLYILAVGPADYLVLRWLRRLELTWFTFPACVAAFTILILVVGGGFVRGASLQREIVVVDHYADSDFCRRFSVGAVLASSDTTYEFKDALPVSSNFLVRTISSDYSDGLTEVTMERGQGRSWSLLRGATGLLVADRISTERPPLDFRILSASGLSIDLEVRNDTGAEIDDGVLVTPTGVYRLQRPGRGITRGLVPRIAENVRAFASSEGHVPKRETNPGRQYPGYDNGERADRGIPEATLNQEARKLVLGLCFLPSDLPGDAERLTGAARGLDASPWVEAGGSLLVAWHATGETRLEVSPTPNRKTAYVMTRVFKGPEK